MPPPVVKIKPLRDEMGKSIALPMRMSEHAAGYDLAAAIDAPISLAPMQRLQISCGFAIQLPPGLEAQIRPRSGLAAKHGITCLNAPGTIDADYRGEVRVILINLGDKPYTIEPGSRVAQMVLAQHASVGMEMTSTLDDSIRGAGGFGSTGS